MKYVQSYPFTTWSLIAKRWKSLNAHHLHSKRALYGIRKPWSDRKRSPPNIRFRSHTYTVLNSIRIYIHNHLNIHRKYLPNYIYETNNSGYLTGLGGEYSGYETGIEEFSLSLSLRCFKVLNYVNILPFKFTKNSIFKQLRRFFFLKWNIIKMIACLHSASWLKNPELYSLLIIHFKFITLFFHRNWEGNLPALAYLTRSNRCVSKNSMWNGLFWECSDILNAIGFTWRGRED